MSHISNQDLLAELLKGPFSHFKKIGQDDWRDPSEKNPSFSLSSKGYIDHKSGTSGSLNDLAKEKNLLILNNHQPASYSQSNTQLKKSSEVDVQRIWEKSEIADHPESKSAALIHSYLTNSRKIPFESYDDLLRKGLIRMNEYRGERMLVYPSLSAETLNDAIEGKPYTVFRIQRIFVDDKGDKLKKKHLGSNLEDPAGFVIPPLNDTGEHLAVIAEGLEDALSIRAKFKDAWIFVAADKAGLKHTSGFFSDGKFKSVLIVADHDTDQNPAITGQAEAWRLGEKLISMGVKSVQVKMPSVPKDDANQALQDGRLSDWLNSLFDIPEQFHLNEQGIRKAKELPSNQDSRLKVLTLKELLTIKTHSRVCLLQPWLPSQGLAMIYAPRGLGKTWFALGLAYAVASGSRFIKWDAPGPQGVLFIDGEMPLSLMQERMQKILNSNEIEPHSPLNFITPDTQENGIPDLSKPEGQKKIDGLLEDVELIILDNLSTLIRSGKENEAESWLPVQEWALKLRAKGKSLLFIHHAGKSGEQRGTSRREDVLDTVLALRRSIDYSTAEGAQFEVHFEKARGLYGDEVAPIDCRLIQDQQGKLTWKHSTLEESTRQKVVSMFNEGVSQADISRVLEINKSVVSRHVKKAREEGEITHKDDPK